MKISVLPEDQVVVVDGVALKVPFEIEANVHAIQWDGDHGVIERKTGAPERLERIEDMLPYVTAWQAAQDELNAPLPPPTSDQIKAALVAAVQAHLDATAAAHGYDNIYTACTYADEPAVAQFQAEGQALRAWRSMVWAHCHGVMAAVQSAQRPVPSAEELIAELPALVMP